MHQALADRLGRQLPDVMKEQSRPAAAGFPTYEMGSRHRSALNRNRREKANGHLCGAQMKATAATGGITKSQSPSTRGAPISNHQFGIRNRVRRIQKALA